MQRGSVDGVPVFWTQAPAPLTAELVFGVGRRDETFLRGGLTHLVEHLAMRVLGRTTLECNATVDLDTTRFTASGPPERVADFLTRVCQALADLPLDRLAVEADVLRTEGGNVVRPAVGALLAESYGGSGLGLAGFGEPARRALTPSDLREFVSTWFVRGNAALWLTGPPPSGLRLPLPEGARPARATQRLRPRATPVLAEQPVEGVVALGGEVARTPGLGAAVRVLRDRVEDDLRHGRGISYAVDVEQLVVDADQRFVAVTADCRDGTEPVTARAVWQALQGLAADGPTEQELSHERLALEDHLSDPRAAVDAVSAAAVAAVTGARYRGAEELRQEARALTREQVRDAAAVLRAAALVVVPFGVDVSLPGVTRLPTWSEEVVAGREFRRRRRGSQAPRGARLVVGADGVTLVLGEGERWTVRYADALGLLRVAPQEWSLTGRDGVSVALAPADWRDGQEALSRVRAAVPPDLQVVADSARPSGRQVLLLHAPAQQAARALWPSPHDAYVVQTERWTLVVREQDELEAYADAVGRSAALGRRHRVLLLQQEHGELELVVLHRGKERDRHLWDGQQHDPSVLAERLDVDAEEAAALLAHPGGPDEVLAALTAVLGVPEQTARVLSGAAPEDVPGLVHLHARGFRDTVVAEVRGEYDPPDSTALLHRLLRWERERPPAYRAVNAAFAVAEAAGAGLLAVRVRGRWRSRTGALAVLLACDALSSLWSARRPSPSPTRAG